MENNIKVQNWLGNEIRFVEVNNEWMAVGIDVAKALGYKDYRGVIRKKLKDSEKLSSQIDHAGQKRKVTLINNKTIYKLIFRSNLPQAEEFTDWVTDIIEELRESANLTAFELMDKEKRKLATDVLKNGIDNAEPKHYAKAHTIANKAVSNMYGFNKLVQVKDMTPDMLRDRQNIYEAVIEVMIANDRYNLGLSVSKTIYEKFGV